MFWANSQCSNVAFGNYTSSTPAGHLLLKEKALLFKLQGTSKNSPFGIWANLSIHKCVMKKSQYTKYSAFSITFSEWKSPAQILKK